MTVYYVMIRLALEIRRLCPWVVPELVWQLTLALMAGMLLSALEYVLLEEAWL